MAKHDNHKAQGNGFHKLSFGDGQTGAAIVYNPDNGRVKTMYANGNAQSNAGPGVRRGDR